MPARSEKEKKFMPPENPKPKENMEKGR